MSGSDEFEYESDADPYGAAAQEEDNEEAIEIENTFYEADDSKHNSPEQALEHFMRVVAMEASRGSAVVWRFKALQNIVILCARLAKFEEMASSYKELLGYMDQVPRNDASEAINTVLDSVSSASDVTKLETIYEQTLDVLKATSNQRLWFSTSVKLAKLHLDLGEKQKLEKLIKILHKTCQKPDGADDVSKGSQLLEVYAMEIQMCTLTKNSVRMKEIYPKTINLTSAIADPRNIAVIRESGGRMFMSERKWEAAYNEFFEAFKNYQEIGISGRAKLMLQYVVVANMLALSSINPFDSREAKVYQDEPEIRDLVILRAAYESNDIHTIDRLLVKSSSRIHMDTFISTYMEDLLRNIRMQVLQDLAKPYRCVGLGFLAREINVSNEVVVGLLVELILDEKISARIDGVNEFLHMTIGSTEVSKKMSSVHKWAVGIEKINQTLQHKMGMMHCS